MPEGNSTLKETNTDITYDKIIFSSNKPVHEVMAYLSDINAEFRVLLGCYEGGKETSFIAEGNLYGRLDKDGILAGQESVLFLGLPRRGAKVRNAYVLFLATLKEQEIGEFRSVPRHVAEQMGGWSYEPVSKQWFTVIPTQ